MANENTPLVPATPGEPITAGKWNRLQTELRNEVHAHRHTGQWTDGLFDGPPIGTEGLVDGSITTAKLADQSVTGAKVDPSAALVVSSLQATAQGLATSAAAGRFDGPLVVNLSGAQAFQVGSSRVSVTGALRVGGAVEAKADLSVAGAVTAASLSAAGSMQAAGLTVSGAASVSGTLSVDKDLTLKSNLTLEGQPVIRLGSNARVSSGTVVGVVGFVGAGASHGQLAYRAGKGFELVDVSNAAPSVDFASSRPNAALITGALTANGDAGITGTLSVYKALTAAADVFVGSNPLKFSSAWSNFPAGATHRAEISNDTGTYKTLMIVGNRSAGGVRRVGLWDEVTIAGNLGIGSSAVPAARLHVRGGSDASLSAHGFMVLGETNGTNLCLDDNEIIARKNGSASPLYLNANGGGVVIGDQQRSDLTVKGSLRAVTDNNEFSWNGAADLILRCKSRGANNKIGGRALVHDSDNWLTINYGMDFTGVRVHGLNGASSRALKDEIRPLEGDEALALLRALEPSCFVWRHDAARRPTHGFIAEDVPDTVGSADKLGVDPLAILAGVTRAVQTLLARIDALETQLVEARAT